MGRHVAGLSAGVAEELNPHEQGEGADGQDQERQHPREEPLEESVDGEHGGILSGPRRPFCLTLPVLGRVPGRRVAAGDMLRPMETPKDDTDQTAEDEAEEAAKKTASDVESYESEWYEVLKRRAAELEEAAEDDET